MDQCIRLPQMPLMKAGEQYMVISQQEASGPQMKSHHINYLELLAVFRGLKYSVDHTAIRIKLKIDDTTAVVVINHMENSHSTEHIKQ